MSELYTSLVRAKQELGGALPPMTAASDLAQIIFDPAFCMASEDGRVGRGGLVEDEVRGLRCPVRGCGHWVHSLSRHLNACHAEVGGSDGVKEALDLPRGQKLASRANREKHRLNADVMRRDGRLRPPPTKKALLAASTPEARAKSHTKAAATARSYNQKNLRRSCDAQVVRRMFMVRDKVGRSPGALEAESLDPGLVRAAVRVYGTWNNAKRVVGFDTMARGWGHRRRSVDDVVGACAEFYGAHGRLPSSEDARWAARSTPALPAYQTILRALSATSWDEAIRRVAVRLNIRGGRHGLSVRPATEAAD